MMMRSFSLLAVVGLFLVSAGARSAEQASVENPCEKNRSQEETPWVTWANKNDLAAEAVLKCVRDRLLQNNLRDANISYDGYGKQVNCTKQNVRFRSADGTCNDLASPL